MIEFPKKTKQIKINDKVFEIYDVTVKLNEKIQKDPTSVPDIEVIKDASNLSDDDIKSLRVSESAFIVKEIIKLSYEDFNDTGDSESTKK